MPAMPAMPARRPPPLWCGDPVDPLGEPSNRPEEVSCLDGITGMAESPRPGDRESRVVVPKLAVPPLSLLFVSLSLPLSPFVSSRKRDAPRTDGVDDIGEGGGGRNSFKCRGISRRERVPGLLGDVLGRAVRVVAPLRPPLRDGDAAEEAEDGRDCEEEEEGRDCEDREDGREEVAGGVMLLSDRAEG